MHDDGSAPERRAHHRMHPHLSYRVILIRKTYGFNKGQVLCTLLAAGG
jgi:hypothetical protein